MIPIVTHILSNESFWKMLWDFIKALFGLGWIGVCYFLGFIFLVWFFFYVGKRMDEVDKNDSGFWPWWFS